MLVGVGTVCAARVSCSHCGTCYVSGRGRVTAVNDGSASTWLAWGPCTGVYTCCHLHRTPFMHRTPFVFLDFFVRQCVRVCCCVCMLVCMLVCVFVCFCPFHSLRLCASPVPSVATSTVVPYKQTHSLLCDTVKPCPALWLPFKWLVVIDLSRLGVVTLQTTPTSTTACTARCRCPALPAPS